MKRILMLVLTNLAVVALLLVTARLLGVDRFLIAQGLHLGSLLVFSAIIGFGGAFLSLAMSKWMAKISTGAQVIDRPRDQVVDRALSSNSDEEYQGPGIACYVTSIAAEFLLGILASAVVLWFGRQREFRADAGGARLAGRAKMIAALERLRAMQDQPTHLPSEMAAFGINGGAAEGLKRLFLSHPPLDERIAALGATATY